MMTHSEAMRDILGEVRDLLAGADEAQAAAFCQAVGAADEVFVTAQGRSRLVAAAFATRLAHLGKRAHVVSEPTTPAVTAGALLLACSGSGSTPTTVAHARRAAEVGAAVWAITGEPASPLARAADEVIVIPPLPSAQPGKSAFEQALLIYLDAAVLRLMALLGQGEGDMLARHSNLE